VCPGQPLDPRAAPASAAVARSCPRKYLADGSAGLGLASRFPGHTQVIGRDRARLARALGWPSGDASHDRRSLALESGAWLLALVLGGWLVGRRRDLDEMARSTAGVIGLATVSLLLLALLSSPTLAAHEVGHGGPTLLAILLVLIPGRRELPALPCALLLALLAAAPLAGSGDAVVLVAIIRDRLLDLGLGWSLATALAGSLATVALTIGAGISAAALLDRSRPSRDPDSRERRHAAWISLALALACGLGLALRKPVDDLALLPGAAALLVLGTYRMRSGPQQMALTLVCAVAAAAPILDGDARSPVAVGLVGLLVLLCLGVGLGPGSRRGPSPAAEPPPA
jgi:hypothetical protein